MNLYGITKYSKKFRNKSFLREQVFWSTFSTYPTRHLQMYEFPLLTHMCWQSCPWAHASELEPEKKHSPPQHLMIKQIISCLYKEYLVRPQSQRPRYQSVAHCQPPVTMEKCVLSGQLANISWLLPDEIRKKDCAAPKTSLWFASQLPWLPTVCMKDFDLSANTPCLLSKLQWN